MFPGDQVEGGQPSQDPSAVDPRVRNAVVLTVANTVGAAGVVWGAIYLLLGLPGASVYPFTFSVATLINVLAHRRHRDFRRYVAVELALVLLIPTVLMLHLGGFTPSGGVGLWALVAPIGALLAVGPTATSLAVFIGFVSAVGAGVWANSAVRSVETLPPAAVDMFLLINVAAVSLVAFWGMRTFLVTNDELRQEQVRLRAIEKTYVAQEAMMHQHERLATLGKLSAGISHELNNPAAAVGRATVHLGEVVHRLIDNATAMLRLGVSHEGLSWVAETARNGVTTDPIELSDREDRLGRWLEAREVDDPWELASALAELGFDTDSLGTASERYSERQILSALGWISDVSRANRLITEMRTGTGRISEIVAALKGYSHMDSSTMLSFDVRAGIEDTLVILKSKLQGIEIRKHFPDALPLVTGHPGELNQVWTNLIANAAEALDGSGSIMIEAAADDDAVRVMIEDDGPGIPETLIDSVFDPFVTTKAPGEGTGLGLNLSHQIVVDRHGGSIRVESTPGRTRFTVRLPATEQ